MLETARHYEFKANLIAANAPRTSGLYALFQGAGILLIGESDNIFASLMDHLHGRGPSASAVSAFAYEVCSPERRRIRHRELVFRYKPAYTDRPELKLREL